MLDTHFPDVPSPQTLKELSQNVKTVPVTWALHWLYRAKSRIRPTTKKPRRFPAHGSSEKRRKRRALFSQCVKLFNRPACSRGTSLNLAYKTFSGKSRFDVAGELYQPQCEALVRSRQKNHICHRLFSRLVHSSGDYWLALTPQCLQGQSWPRDNWSPENLKQQRVF